MADFDRLLVAGNLTAGGNILLSLIDGFAPSAGETFDIADFTTFTNGGYTFDISGAQLDPGLEWDLSSFPATGTIAVIPEPATTATLVAALALLTLPRRRRHH